MNVNQSFAPNKRLKTDSHQLNNSISSKIITSQYNSNIEETRKQEIIDRLIQHMAEFDGIYDEIIELVHQQEDGWREVIIELFRVKNEVYSQVMNEFENLLQISQNP